jgi:hypothetical protein
MPTTSNTTMTTTQANRRLVPVRPQNGPRNKDKMDQH